MKRLPFTIALILTLAACHDPPLMDQVPPDFRGPTVTTSASTTPVDSYIDLTVTAEFELNPWTSRESVHVGETAIGFCLIPSDELLEEAKCEPSTVLELPTGSGLATEDPLSSVHDVLAKRGEPVTISHNIALTSEQRGDVTVVGVVFFLEETRYYGNYIYADEHQRLFIQFD